MPLPSPLANVLPTSSTLVAAKRSSPIIEPKREDLTSRLQKEFGLLVDTDTNDEDPGEASTNEEGGGDVTPEEDSPPPPPSASNRFLPTQIPSYTQNYPPAPRPVTASSNSKAKYPPPPPPPSVASAAASTASNYNYPPPPPPPPSSGNLNFLEN